MNEVKEHDSLEQMIRQQVIERGIADPAVLDAMRSVPRERFFSGDQRDSAFADKASPIGHGQTISQPYMVALMTQRLDLARGHRVLEIGTGSGYQTAILARLSGEVYTVERVKPLLDEAWERLMDLGIRNVHFRHGDGMLGWPDQAPFDRILITAGAPRVPEKLLRDQLRDGGVAVVPVGPDDGQMLLRIVRRGRKLEPRDVVPCRFVKLIGQGAWDDPSADDR